MDGLEYWSTFTFNLISIANETATNGLVVWQVKNNCGFLAKSLTSNKITDNFPFLASHIEPYYPESEICANFERQYISLRASLFLPSKVWISFFVLFLLFYPHALGSVSLISIKITFNDDISSFRIRCDYLSEVIIK